MTTRSAVSSDGASSQPAVNRRPAISSESLRFIWQPSVPTWKRGSVRASGRYSARRSSADRPGGAASVPTPIGRGSSMSRTGRARDGDADVTHKSAIVRRRTAAPRSRKMELLTNPETWIALATLTLLEIVLGIDNVIFISILVQRLPAGQRDRARLIGLSLAMGMRIAPAADDLLDRQPDPDRLQPVRSGPVLAGPDPDRRRSFLRLEGHDRDPRIARRRARPSHRARREDGVVRRSHRPDPPARYRLLARLRCLPRSGWSTRSRS